MPAQTTIRLRQGTATEWTTANPVLASGEQGYETNTKRLKVGDGVSTWSALTYFASSSVTVSPTAPITSLSGDLWFDSTDGQTYIRYVDADSSQWVAVSGASATPSFQLGAITPWAADAIPSWALELTGQAVSRTTYSGLFALLGTSYGAGNGTTTFNIPDYRGRTLVGHDASQTEFDVLGEAGGAKTHTLTTAQMPSHTHIQNSHIHGGSWTQGFFAAGGTSAVIVLPGGSAIFETSSTQATNQNTGSDQPHNNLQPYTVVKWIICAASSSGNFDTEVQTALVSNVSTLQTSVSTLQVGRRLAETLYFTTSANFNKLSYPWLAAVKVRLVGGGGGGGSSNQAGAGVISWGMGGSGAGYAESFITNIAGLSNTTAVSVGAGGGSSQNGGTSSFGTLVVAGGGIQGGTKIADIYGQYPPVSAGGVGITGNFITSGSPGGPGDHAEAFIGSSGVGGSSQLGGGATNRGSGGGGSSFVGNAATGYGGGGGGALTTTGALGALGGAGAPGIVIVELYA